MKFRFRWDPTCGIIQYYDHNRPETLKISQDFLTVACSRCTLSKMHQTLPAKPLERSCVLLTELSPSFRLASVDVRDIRGRPEWNCPLERELSKFTLIAAYAT